MRVLQINSRCGIGSTGRIATDLHSALVDQGHESYIAYGRGTPINCDTAIKIGSRTDVYAHVVLTRLFDKHGFGSNRATRAFIERVEVIDPDIIHLHNVHGYYISVELLFQYLRKTRKPVVWTLHDCWAFTGHCAYFDYVGCDKWRTRCRKCPQKATYPSSVLVDGSKQNHERKRKLFTGLENMVIVTPSQWLASLVNESFLGRYPVMVINNGIDLDTFRVLDSVPFRERYGLRDKFIILGVAGPWGERKGLRYFLELSRRITGEDVIVLVGLSRKQARRLPENTLAITRTDDLNELVEIYNAADVFVNPTLEDNFPTTNLEAMACGTPVVTFSTGGSVESVDANTGFVVARGDISGLADAVKCVKQKGKSTFRADALNRARLLYDRRLKCSKYIALYKQMLRSSLWQ